MFTIKYEKHDGTNGGYESKSYHIEEAIVRYPEGVKYSQGTKTFTPGCHNIGMIRRDDMCEIVVNEASYAAIYIENDSGKTVAIVRHVIKDTDYPHALNFKDVAYA